MRAEEVPPPDPCLGRSSVVLEPDFLVEDEAWSGVDVDFDIHFQQVREVVLFALSEQGVLPYDPQSGVVLTFCVKLSNADEIKVLNSHYRGKDMATNVLSFPAHENLIGDKEFLLKFLSGEESYLGDIILNYSDIMAESIERNKTFIAHYTHLLVHSILHLFGYDHLDDKEAEKMENLEIYILDKLGITNPYQSI